MTSSTRPIRSPSLPSSGLRTMLERWMMSAAISCGRAARSAHGDPHTAIVVKTFGAQEPTHPLEAGDGADVRFAHPIRVGEG